VGIKQFGVNGKKRSKISAVAAYTTHEKYGAVGGLSTAAASAELSRISWFGQTFRVAKARRLGECPPAHDHPEQIKDFP
jgi:hypothetical protein